MKLQRTKLGFTLIELLVVITIIGILATGAIGVYTSQIQKARDTTRITDMSALKGSLEQAFQDMGMYPGNASTIADTTACNAAGTTTTSGIYCIVELGFLNSLPKDPKNGQNGNGSPLIYTYNYEDVNGVINQAFEVSTGIESDGFKASKAPNSADGGNDDNRIEFGTLKGKSGGSSVEIHSCLVGNTACTGDSDNTAVTVITSCTTAGNAIIVAGDCS